VPDLVVGLGVHVGTSESSPMTCTNVRTCRVARYPIGPPVEVYATSGAPTRVKSVSHTVARERMAPLELTVAAVVAAIIAAEAWFLVASVAVGLAREIKHDGGSCPDGMAVALTRQGEIACMPPGMRLPHGWIVMSSAG
jgi:hypothetical protein